MSQLSTHHRILTDGVGKCSVPMWCNGMPAGFCDKPAYGEQVPRQTRYDGYIPALCCHAHGGPERIMETVTEKPA